MLVFQKFFPILGQELTFSILANYFLKHSHPFFLLKYFTLVAHEKHTIFYP